MWSELVNAFLEEVGRKILGWLFFGAAMMAAIGGSIIYLIMK